MDQMERLSQSTLDSMEKWRQELASSLLPQQILIVGIVVVVAVFVVTAFIVFRKLKSRVDEVKAFVKGTGTPSKPRFRKRDKVMFYGHRIFRKVKSLGGNSRAKQKKLMKMAKKIFDRRGEKQTQLMVTEPPAEFLEEARSEELSDQKLPKEVLYMLKSIRVFGQFETPLFLELCKHLETIKVRSGQLLFTVGDPDENVYVVQQGKLNVYINTVDGSPLSLKNVPAGESIISLLSFTDVLTGHPQPFKTVSARAVEDSTVLRLPVSAFQEVFEVYPDTFVRVIQIVMVRLQRITFTALQHYLGLGQELLKKQVNPKSRAGSGTYAHLVSSPHHTLKKKERPTTGSSRGATEVPEVTVSVDPTEEPTTSGHRSIMSSRSKTNLVGGSPRESSPEEDATEQQALEWFMKHLCLEDDSLLKGKVVVWDLPAQSCLIQQDSLKEAAIFCVLSGSCYVSQRHSETEETQLFVVHTGELVGHMGVLSGEPSLFTIRTKMASRIAVLRKDDFYSIMAVNPKVVLHVAHSVVTRMSSFVRQIDFSLDWHTVESGRAIYRQGDMSDCFYICLSGRLRSVITQHGKKTLVAEYGRGDLVGIVELLTRKERSTTVMAVRDTELAKLSEGLLDLIKLKYPSVVTRLIQLLSHRILGSWQKTGPSVESPLPVSVDVRASQSNLSTIAILAISDDVPLSAFTLELYHALTVICSVLRLTSDYIRRTVGAALLDQTNEYRLSNWLAQQEDQHRIVLYQCDQSLTNWTSRCIRQADAILIVGMADKEPTVGKIEKQLDSLAVRIQKELVLLHRVTEEKKKPKHSAVDWLNARSWCSFHHNIRCPNRMFQKKSQARIADMYNTVFEKPPSMHSDFSRLARILTGNAVGLVLGGGGARGMSHIGMIKAIQEANIPIDMVGGTSIGAFIGALWAKETDEMKVTETAKRWANQMTQWWRQALDLTYPLTAMFSGRGFNRTIMDAMGEETNIEDMWVPYFTVTTDISSSCMRVHTHGSLWRYVRASMSLSGYMPPLCDPTDGHLLLDGGYVNNLPADVMRSHGARTVLAVDVGSQDESNLCNYGDYLSGWWLLWKKWNPFAESMKVPSLAEIQSRLAYVSCVRQLEEVKTSDYCEYIRPPIDRYKTLQFGSFDEIKEVGYNHGKTYFAGLSRGGKENLASIFVPYTKTKTKDFVIPSRNTDPRGSIGSANFIDLAEVVCRVNQPVRQISKDSDDESDEDFDDDDDDEEEAEDEEAEDEEEEAEGYHSEPTFPNNEEDGLGNQSDAEIRRRPQFSLSENEL